MDWRHSKDGLPEEDKMVLVWSGYPTHPYMVVSFDYSLKCWIDYDEYPYDEKNTYWMPLPEPPKNK
jgi:hypothetical protein